MQQGNASHNQQDNRPGNGLGLRPKRNPVIRWERQSKWEFFASRGWLDRLRRSQPAWRRPGGAGESAAPARVSRTTYVLMSSVEEIPHRRYSGFR